MTLAQSILDNLDRILGDWETFARSLPPGRSMSAVALRDDAERMLRFVAADMETPQSEGQRDIKGRGEQGEGAEDTAAHAHGHLRAVQAFDLAEMVSEFRALRASVISLWSNQEGAPVPTVTLELIRFNEAMDQILAESVRRYAAEMERSRELLLAVLGHDLRNPLSSITMSAAVLARTSLDSRQTKLAAGIIHAGERMSKMIHDLLDFTRTRLGAKLIVNRERCDFEAVCRTIADESQSGHPDRQVAVHSSGDCEGSWDPERMAQLVSNLVGNAVQHGRPDTPVAITIDGHDADSVTLLVENQGAAIPAELCASIFDPLNRGPSAVGHNEPGSLGLGLYIAKEIALAHKGTIRLVRSDESGTMFEAVLPRVGDAA
jgi:signal transduction histidine kinase